MAKESIRIVIINDDSNDVSLLRRCLINESGQKYSFDVAKTGEMGIQACLAPGSLRTDCVIVDLHLPDMSGLDVLKRLKDDAGEVQYPVVLFIDSGEECKAATAGLRDGAHDYIAKSWLTADGLACAVENAIERFKLRERLKKKRATLERQDREFRALVENVPDIITRFDTEFRHVCINPAIEQATGLPPESFLGKTSREAGMPAKLCDFWESVLKQAMVGGSELTFEFDYETPSGLRCYQARLVPLFSAAGEVDSVLAVSTDVTEGKRAEEARARLAAIVESSEDAIISKTLDGVIRSWNAGAKRLFGYSHQEAVGQPITLIIPPERQDEERRILERLCRGERVEHFETVRVSKDGRRLDISLILLC